MHPDVTPLAVQSQPTLFPHLQFHILFKSVFTFKKEGKSGSTWLSFRLWPYITRVISVQLYTNSLGVLSPCFEPQLFMQ